jgi:hypothetical protein
LIKIEQYLDNFINIVESEDVSIEDKMERFLAIEAYLLQKVRSDPFFKKSKHIGQLIVCTNLYFKIRDIITNLYKNPNISTLELEDFIKTIIPFLKQVHENINKKPKEQAIALTQFQDIVYFWINSRKRKTSGKMPFIEKLVCSYSPENEKMKQDVIQKCKEKIEDVIQGLHLKIDDVILVFLKKRFGTVGMVLFLPDIVRHSGVSAMTLNMNISPPNCFGGIPTDKDCIIIGDNLSYELLEARDMLKAMGGSLRAMIVIIPTLNSFKINTVML